MQKKNVVLSGILLLVMTLCQQAWSGTTIGINFCDHWAGPQLEGKVSNGFDNWTDSVPAGSEDTPSGSRTILGTDDLVTVTWTSKNTWAAGNSDNDDQQLFRVYLDDSDNLVNVTIEGLGDWLASEGLGAYSLRIYQSTDNGAGFVPIDIVSGSTVLQTVQETNHWTNEGGVRAYVDSGVLSADSIIVDPQNRTGNSGGDKRACIAAIKIVGIDLYNPVNPTPEVGLEVGIDPVLTWEQLPEVADMGVTYNVYFGSEPNELSDDYYGNTIVKTTSSDPADFFYSYGENLLNSTTYYWKVDAVETGGTVHEGPEWSFVTQPASARIETQPVSLTVAAGSDAVFSIGALNGTMYQWYKDGSPLADDATDTLYTGENTDTLTILDVQLDDEAYFYCVVDNSLNTPAESKTVRLLTQRLMGWWELDGDLSDSVNDVVPGVPAYMGTTVDPNYVANGVSGEAMEFFGTPEDLVTFTDSAEYYNFYPQGYSVSAWVNIAGYTGNWAGIVSKESVLENGRNGFFLICTNNGEAVHTLRQSFNDLYSGVDVIDGNWHLITGTYDGNTARIFVDGKLANETVNSTIVDQGPADLIFGAETSENSSAFVGLLDDVRIWNYAIDPVDAAMLYIDVNPEIEICVEYPELDIAGPDGVGDEYRDCKIDLYDLAPLASTWLECNVAPTCIQ